MNPRVVVHNAVSLDGSYVGFEVDMGLHYQLAASFNAGAHLVGSVTALSGLEMFGGQPQQEEASDFEKPHKEGSVPYWVVVDSAGSLRGRLHELRRSEWCRDVVLLVSRRTSADYLDYLARRHYDYFVSGDEHVDLAAGLAWLGETHGLQTVLTDGGPTLVGALLNAGLVDEISLLAHPLIIGRPTGGLFRFVRENLSLRLTHQEVVGEGCLWVVYRVHGQ